MYFILYQHISMLPVVKDVKTEGINAKCVSAELQFMKH